MASEHHSWGYARDRLAPFGVLHRVENGVAKGTPDTLYCLLGVSGLIEMKATLETLEREQVMFAERWAAAGGLCHALIHADRAWILLDAAGLRATFEKREYAPVVRSGEFPLRELLRALAPPELRRAASK